MDITEECARDKSRWGVRIRGDMADMNGVEKYPRDQEEMTICCCCE